MLENILFFALFLSQIVIVSHYYPKLIDKRVGQVLQNYPPSTHPKLYAKPLTHYESGRLLYRIANRVILAIGLVLLCYLGYWSSTEDVQINELIPFAYWGFQIMPIMAMELFGFAYFKLMKQADKRKIRNANLNPRRLLDFVSPAVLGLVVLMYIGTILFMYSVNGFQLHPSNDTLIVFVALTLMNLLFMVVIKKNLSGKKSDPHQSHEDRIRKIQTSIRSLMSMSLVASIFIITVEAMEVYELDRFVSSLMSLYLQLTIIIGLGSTLRSLKIEDINFDVYQVEIPVIEN